MVWTKVLADFGKKKLLGPLQSYYDAPEIKEIVDGESYNKE